MTVKNRCGEKLYAKLNRSFYDQCPDINSAVRLAGRFRLKVIHGGKDTAVPFSCGQKLFDAAASPKEFIPIASGNHLFTSSKSMKKLLAAICGY